MGKTVDESGDLVHVLFDSYNIDDSVRIFGAVYQECAKLHSDPVMLGRVKSALSKGIYNDDPACVVSAFCDTLGGSCNKRLCAGDIWTTPQYYFKHIYPEPHYEDCDGKALFGAVVLGPGSQPMYCDGGEQTHVLNYIDVASVKLDGVLSDGVGIDYAVRGGMPTYGERRCAVGMGGANHRGGHMKPFDRNSVFAVILDKE